MKSSGHSESGGNKFLADIQQTDTLIHVLRCFDDDSLLHVEGSVDPVRDREIVDLELQVRDLDLVERKIQRMEKAAKSGEKEPKHAIEVLQGIKNHLENFESVRTITLTEEERRHIADLFLLTAKPVLYVCNVDDASAINGNAYVKRIREAVKKEDTEVLVIAGPWVFEDRLTIQYQVQEMLRVERIFAPEGIQGELDAYNTLIPDGRNWKDTLMLEFPDAEERKAALARLKGVESRCFVQVEGFDRVWAVADEDLERENEQKTSSVHWLRFELSPAMRAAVKSGAQVSVGIDHPAYGHAVSLSGESRQALARDLD